MRKNSLIIFFTLLVTFACEKEYYVDKDPFTEVSSKSEMTILGDKLENPYSVYSMNTALSNLKSSDQGFPSIVIDTSHLYIRFLPKDFRELDILKKDSTLILFEIPLDYEISEPGTYYHDPTLSADQITWQYCAVEKEKELPEVFYEILEYLFIPEEYMMMKKSINYSESDIERLVEESLRITGNYELDSQKKSVTGSWTPKGTIRAWDTSKGTYVPMKGAEVRATRWFTTHKGIVNSAGDYTCDGTFNNPANYQIVWDRYQFSIRTGSIGQATYDGPKKEGDWDLDIRYGSSEFHALIFRGAYRYYYEDINGLRRPPMNGTFQPQMKIGAHYESNPDYNGVFHPEIKFMSIFEWVEIWNPTDPSNYIFSVVIHELAHASHWEMDHGDFWDTEKVVIESWASGVQVEITDLVYSGFSRSYYRKRYTGIVKDLIDGIGTTVSYYYYDAASETIKYQYKTYSDNVSGYTIRQIEDALKNKETWNDWEISIKNKYSNATEENLDDAFTYWNAE